MSTNILQNHEKKRAERLRRRRQELMEAVRKDMQTLQKIVAVVQQKPVKQTA